MQRITPVVPLLLAALVLVLLSAPSSSGRTWYITPDGSGDAPTIQAGVDSAAVGDIVQLAHGVFTEAGIYLDRDIVLRGDPGHPESVVIDGQRTDRILYGRSFLAIEGLTFRNGHASWLSHDGEHGGALRCRAIAGSISSCIFDNNKALICGGAVSLRGSSISMHHCRFIQNSATYGGGMSVHGGMPQVTECEFSGNDASYLGGGAYLCSDAVRLGQCFFTDNTAAEWGGAIHVWDASSTVEYCVFTGNEATYGGGMSFHDSCWLASVAHCTFVGNRAFEGGALAKRSDYMNLPVIEWSLVAFQVEGGAFGDPGLNPGTFVLRCCDVYGNAGGDWGPETGGQLGQEGNISVDPFLCDRASGDFTLHADSPCLPGNHPTGWNCGLIGALGQGCGPVALTPQTWARVKARYK